MPPSHGAEGSAYLGGVKNGGTSSLLHSFCFIFDLRRDQRRLLRRVIVVADQLARSSLARADLVVLQVVSWIHGHAQDCSGGQARPAGIVLGGTDMDESLLFLGGRRGIWVFTPELDLDVVGFICMRLPQFR